MIKLVLDTREYPHVYVDHEELVNQVVIERLRTRSLAKMIGEKKSLELVTSKGIGKPIVRGKSKKVVAEQSQQVVISKENRKYLIDLEIKGFMSNLPRMKSTPYIVIVK